MSEWLRRLDLNAQLMVWADTASTGLWLFEGEPADGHNFGLTRPFELANRFERWMDMSIAPNVTNERIDDEGRALARALKAWVGARRVVYRTELGEDEEVLDAG